MEYFSEYKKQNEPEKYQKAENWGIAIGLQQVDNLTPSKYLINVAKDNIEGKISIDEANAQVSQYYKKNPAKTVKQQDEKEIDSVSLHAYVGIAYQHIGTRRCIPKRLV